MKHRSPLIFGVSLIGFAFGLQGCQKGQVEASAGAASASASSGPRDAKAFLPEMIGGWEGRKRCAPPIADGKFPESGTCGQVIDIAPTVLKCRYSSRHTFNSSMDVRDSQINFNSEYKLVSATAEGNSVTATMEYKSRGDNDREKAGRAQVATIVLLPDGKRISVSGLDDSDCNGTFVSDSEGTKQVDNDKDQSSERTKPVDSDKGQSSRENRENEGPTEKDRLRDKLRDLERGLPSGGPPPAPAGGNRKCRSGDPLCSPI